MRLCAFDSFPTRRKVTSNYEIGDRQKKNRAFLSDALQGAGVAAVGLGLAGFASSALAAEGGELGDLSADGGATPMGSPVSEEDARIARKLAAQVLYAELTMDLVIWWRVCVKAIRVDKICSGL